MPENIENQTESIVDITHLGDNSGEKTEDLKSLQKEFKKKDTNMLKKILIIGGGLVLGGLLVMFLITSFSGGDGKFVSPLADVEFGDFGTIGGAINLLTGEPLSKAVDTRPFAVMVNNHIDARPQSGLIYADLVYEIVAEGGITRFLSFYFSESPEKIGPVRSTREYYLVLVKELGDAMLMHIGWSPQALEAIETWPVRSLGRGGAQFWRDNPRGVATEHTAYVDGAYLRELGVELGWDGFTPIEPWAFKDDNKGFSGAATASKIAIDFWFRGDYSAVFEYNSENNTYMRFMGYDADGNPISHADQETKEQIEIKNLIVQFVTESPIAGDDKNRLEYELISTGTGLVFLDGKVIDVTWSKDSRDERTVFYDQDGQEMEFNRGKMWISVVPDRNQEQVVYE